MVVLFKNLSLQGSEKKAWHLLKGSPLCCRKKTVSCPQRVAPHFLHFCIYLAEVLQGCHCFAQPSTKKEQQPKNLHKQKTKTNGPSHELLHPGRLTWNLQISHLERKMIWTKPTWNYVPAVNLQGYKWTEISMAFHQRYHHHPATALWSHATLPVNSDHSRSRSPQANYERHPFIACW